MWQMTGGLYKVLLQRFPPAQQPIFLMVGEKYRCVGAYEVLTVEKNRKGKELPRDDYSIVSIACSSTDHSGHSSRTPSWKGKKENHTSREKGKLTGN